MEYHEYTALLRAIEDQFGLDYDYLCYLFNFQANHQWPIDGMEAVIIQFALNPVFIN